jgi:hypothetical protein
MRDIVSEVGTFYTGLSNPPAIKTTQTSPTVDLQGYDGAQIYIICGTYTDGTLTPAINESSDGTTWTAVANTDLVAWTATSATNFTPVKVGNSQPAAISSAGTAINQRIGYIGGKRYLQVVTTVTGSPATGCQYDVIIHAGRPRFMPSKV